MMKDPQTAQLMERAQEPFYSFEPYFKRSDGEPGWQWQFLLNADRTRYKGRVALGANRIGKSEMGAYEAVLAVCGEHPTIKFSDSGIGWIVGLDNPMIRDIDRPLFEKFMPQHVKVKSKFYKQDNIWEVRTDKTEWQIGFKSTEMGRDKFQGAKVDFAWIDEEPKNTDIFSEIEARLIDRRGVWWMTATPVRGTAWLKALSEREDVFTTFAGMKDNPYLPLDEIEKYAKTLPEDEAAVRIDGAYIIWGGNPVFHRPTLLKIMERINKEVPAPEGILREIAV